MKMPLFACSIYLVCESSLRAVECDPVKKPYFCAGAWSPNEVEGECEVAE